MTAPPQVIKIGGSVLGTPDDYVHAACRVAREILARRTWIVVSAARGVTDLLQGSAGPPDRTTELLRRHEELAGRPAPAWQEADLRRGLHEASTRGARAVLAWGEQASAWAFQARLEDAGALAPVVELYPRKRLAPVPCAVVPGFYLRDRHGRARTLPRGGSDITAALLAVRLGSTLVRFWKEGGGIRSGEGVVLAQTDAKSLLSIIGDEIRPLHPAALRIADRAGLEFVLEDPSGRWPSTRVVARAELAAVA